MSQQKMWRILLVVCFSLLLIGCSSGSPATAALSVSPTAAPTMPTPTTPSFQSGTVLYQADWSHGLAGWQGSQGWHVSGGQLQSDAGQDLSIAAPYQPTIPNYAIEVRIQMASVVENGASFAIAANPLPEKSGYRAGVADLRVPGKHTDFSFPEVQITIDPLNAMEQGSGMPKDFPFGSEWHTYRVEVQDGQASFYVDGTQVGYAASTQSSVLSNGPIQLRSSMLLLHVSSFRILSL